jgi:NAD dependent epimerase/dehydratase family enzyme
MAENERTSEREANIRTVLGRIGLALRESGGGYQVVDASTLKAIAGSEGHGGYSMSLKDAEDFTLMATWAHGKPGREEQLRQGTEMAGWNPDSPHAGLPEGTGLVLSDPSPSELQ